MPDGSSFERPGRQSEQQPSLFEISETPEELLVSPTDPEATPELSAAIHHSLSQQYEPTRVRTKMIDGKECIRVLKKSGKPTATDLASLSEEVMAFMKRIRSGKRTEDLEGGHLKADKKRAA